MAWIPSVFLAGTQKTCTASAEVVSGHGQSTLTLPPTGAVADQRQAEPAVRSSADGRLLSACSCHGRSTEEQSGGQPADLRFAPGSLVAATGGLLPVPFPTAVMDWAAAGNSQDFGVWSRYHSTATDHTSAGSP